MPDEAPYTVRRIGPRDVDALRGVNEVFAEAFGDAEAYRASPPRTEYVEDLLASGTFIAIAAMHGGDAVVAGLAAYELRKFERERSEIYIYDLAVLEPHRRKGLATALIEELKAIAHERGAYVIYVQADLVDAPAVALYTKLGCREDVLHFDIAVS